MKELSYLDAINEALTEEMARDERVFIMGEDVATGYADGGIGGGIFGTTRSRMIIRLSTSKQIRSLPWNIMKETAALIRIMILWRSGQMAPMESQIQVMRA